jgi:hypothetical protein
VSISVSKKLNHCKILNTRALKGQYNSLRLHNYRLKVDQNAINS